MFEIKKKSKIAKQVDRSDDFWKQFGIYDENTKKVIGLWDREYWQSKYLYYHN